MSSQASRASGVVKVRLLGAPADIEPVAGLLAAQGWVIERSAPYPNRSDPGVRVYVTLRLPEGGQ